MEKKPEPISVKITRAEKRGRKVIICFESDLYSDEIFAVTPFYDEGDAKNQLQDAHFVLKVSEKSGELKASVDFTCANTHYTKGHSQLHYPMSRFFISKIDCVIDWAMTENEEYLNDQRILQVMDMWKGNTEIQNRISAIISERKQGFKLKRLQEAKENYHKAIKELEVAMEIEQLNKSK
ncbi:MAG: hypothetical protein V4538_14965 [Bacteroidota bacterium]